MRRLIVTLPDGSESVHNLMDNIITVGRTGSNKIQINHPSVSAHHAKMNFSNGHYRLKDLDSTNKTFVRGVPISETVLVGMLPVRFGNIECRYEETSAEGSAPGVATPVRAVVAGDGPKEMDTLRKELAKVRAELTSAVAAAETERKKAAAFLEQQEISRQTESQLTAILADTKKQLESTVAERDRLRVEREKLAEQKAQGSEKASAAANAELESLRKELQAVRESGDKRTGDVAGLENRLKQEADRVRELEAQLQRVQAESGNEAGKTAAELAQAKAQITGTAAERDALRAERDKAVFEARELQVRVEKLTNELRAAERQIHELVSKTDAGTAKAASEIADLKSRCEVLNTAVESAAAEKKELTAKLEVLATERGQSQAALEAKGREIEAKGREVEELKAELKARLDASQGELANARKEIEEFSGKLRSTEEQLNSATGKISVLESQLSGASAAVAEAAALKAQSEVATKHAEDLARQLNEARAEIQRLTHGSGELNGKLGAVNSALEDLRREREALQQRIEASVRELKVAVEAREAAERRFADLESKTIAIDEISKGIADERDTVAKRAKELERELAELRGSNGNLERELELLKSQLSTEKKSQGDQVALAEKATQAAEAASRQIEELRHKISELESESRESRKELLEVTARMEQASECAESLADERETLQKENEDLKRRLLESETERLLTPVSQPAIPQAPAMAEVAGATGYRAVAAAAAAGAVKPIPAQPKTAFQPLRPVPVVAAEPRVAARSSGKNPLPATGEPGGLKLAGSVPSAVPPTSPAVPPRTGSGSAAVSMPQVVEDPVFKDFGDQAVQMRALLQNLIRRPSDTKMLGEFHGLIQGALRKSANQNGLKQFNQLSAVVEALVAQLRRVPDRVSSSVLRTVSQSVDVLAMLVDPKKRGKVANLPSATVFMVESDLQTQKEVAGSLDSIHLLLSATDNPHSALSLLDAKAHDLVLINVELPDMNGVELCSRVRLLPKYKKTPILLLTGAPSVGSWAQWSLNGANDFVTKPLNAEEFAVKALAWALRGQINNAG